MDGKRVKWDLLIIILAVYNSIFLPFEIAFRPEYTNYEWVYWFNKSVDITFFIDILVNFRTTYINPITGEEIKKPSKIACNYLSGKFWVDLVSTIPFEDVLIFFPENHFENQEDLQKKVVIISCLKLIRILRLAKLINHLNSSDDFKLQLRLIKLCFILLLYIHITACLWYLFCEIDGNKWIPMNYDKFRILRELNYINPKDDSFYAQPILVKFFISCYHAILVLTGNDIGPVSVR